MKEMLMLLAATISKDECINQLQEALDAYKEAKLLNNEEDLEEADKKLFVATNLFIMNNITKGDLKEAMGHIKNMDKMDKAMRFFDVDKNKN